MKYEGNLNDLIFAAKPVQQAFVVKFNNQVLDLFSNKGKFVHSTEGYAKKALRQYIYANFCQGHYWHKDKNNTFAKEKGWMRNNGKVGISAPEFKLMAKKLTDQLLKDKIFVIEKII